jgi:hypothetical protein
VGSRDRKGPPKSPVDRLVEAGLSAYGRGELDDALVAWESALAIDPEDARAIAYVDYVRQQYDLVAAGAEAGPAEEALGVPFGLGPDEGDYEIELLTEDDMASSEQQTVKLPPGPPVMLDPRDEGWGLADDVAGALSAEARVVELEAEEPPDSFEDKSTAEYENPTNPSGGGRKKPGPSSPGFLPSEHPEPTTDEFAMLEATTGVGQRALGFVKPKDPAAAHARKSKPSLKVNIRTPEERPGTDADPLRPEPPVAPPAQVAEDLGSINLDDFPSGTRPGEGGGLVLELEMGDDDEAAPAPASPAAKPELAKTAPGLDLAERPEIRTHLDRPKPPPAIPAKARQSDFGEKSEGPTRDLGLPKKPGSETQMGQGTQRPPGSGSQPGIGRTAAAETTPLPTTPLPPTAPLPVVPEKSERSTANLSKKRETPKPPVVHDEREEPTLARTRTAEGRAQVIAEVDKAAPPGETPDQRSKRRIAQLIALAQTAAREHQLERAVLAIDAAFTQDPDSAFAQKLIAQNRETIMTVFTEYLGDLERRPRLARSMATVVGEPIDSRAAFLLSRVDGSLTYEELLDVSGMPRLEAGRYLCQLLLRGLLASE